MKLLYVAQLLKFKIKKQPTWFQFCSFSPDMSSLWTAGTCCRHAPWPAAHPASLRSRDRCTCVSGCRPSRSRNPHLCATDGCCKAWKLLIRSENNRRTRSVTSAYDLNKTVISVKVSPIQNFVWVYDFSITFRPTIAFYKLSINYNKTGCIWTNN